MRPSRGRRSSDRHLRNHHGGSDRHWPPKASRSTISLYEMQVAILSDIHGNRHAFEAVLADAEGAGAEEMWCLGDLVGYGAEPDACVELARRHAAICLAGNHDLGVTGEIGLDEFSTGAALAARWTQETIRDANLEFLAALRPSGEESSIGLYHASPRDPGLGVRAERAAGGAVLRRADPARRADRPLARGAVVRAARGRRRDRRAAPRRRRPRHRRRRVAAEPRLGRPAARRRPARGLAAARPRPLAAQWRRVEYDIAGAAAAIRAARLPDSLAERLGYGQ